MNPADKTVSYLLGLALVSLLLKKIYTYILYIFKKRMNRFDLY